MDSQHSNQIKVSHDGSGIWYIMVGEIKNIDPDWNINFALVNTNNQV